MISMPGTSDSLQDLSLQRLDKHHGHVKAGFALDFDKASRTGDVDFRQVVPDYIQSDQQQAAVGQRGPECCRYRPIALGQRLRVRFLRKLRDEAKFDDLAALRRAIAQDAEQARRYFARHG